jgi:adenine deaminase
MKQVSGNIVDIHENKIYPGTILIDGEVIVEIIKNNNSYPNYIIPGLIDAHVHIESSMLVPSEFAKIAIQHGTVATVSDPHEIGNVMGAEGVKFMIENGRETPLKFHWTVPSCVPATDFETSGARISVQEMKALFQYPEIVALAEMMNFPGVIYNSDEVMAKIALTKNLGYPIDGHAPGLLGNDLLKYIQAGISTDHECSTIEEAIEKINNGMKILIRNGSSAKNFHALAPLIDLYPQMVMLCCDDIHPEDLIQGHINIFLREGIKRKLNIFNLLRAASLNPINHYKLNVGSLQVNQKADFCVVNNLEQFDVTETWINGEQVYSKITPHSTPTKSSKTINNFCDYTIYPDDILVPNLHRNFKAIGILDGELLTHTLVVKNTQTGDIVNSDVDNDILKIVVVNRYQQAKPSVGFVNGFGLKSGAIASSVAHDSHNIIAIGTNDMDLISAIHRLIGTKGGIVAIDGTKELLLPLPIGGLMTTDTVENVAAYYLHLNQMVKSMGSNLNSPFMTMSFLALLVIPELKIGDKGLFDVTHFAFTPLFV